VSSIKFEFERIKIVPKQTQSSLKNSSK